MDAPQNNEWGPEMWKILHGLTEKIGAYIQVSHRYMTNTQETEEKRLWFVLLNSLRFSLPCPLCRKHYLEYITSHSIDALVNRNKQLSKDSVRLWLYNLHSSINHRYNKNNIPIESIIELYRNVNYNHSLNIVGYHMQRALMKQWVTRDDIGKTVRILREMFTFYCC